MWELADMLWDEALLTIQEWGLGDSVLTILQLIVAINLQFLQANQIGEHSFRKLSYCIFFKIPKEWKCCSKEKN